MQLKDGKIIICIISDIANEKEAEERLREKEVALEEALKISEARWHWAWLEIMRVKGMGKELRKWVY